MADKKAFRFLNLRSLELELSSPLPKKLEVSLVITYFGAMRTETLTSSEIERKGQKRVSWSLSSHEIVHNNKDFQIRITFKQRSKPLAELIAYGSQIYEKSTGSPLAYNISTQRKGLIKMAQLMLDDIYLTPEQISMKATACRDIAQGISSDTASPYRRTWTKLLSTSVGKIPFVGEAAAVLPEELAKIRDDIDQLRQNVKKLLESEISEPSFYLEQVEKVVDTVYTVDYSAVRKALEEILACILDICGTADFFVVNLKGRRSFTSQRSVLDTYFRLKKAFDHSNDSFKKELISLKQEHDERNRLFNEVTKELETRIRDSSNVVMDKTCHWHGLKQSDGFDGVFQHFSSRWEHSPVLWCRGAPWIGKTTMAFNLSRYLKNSQTTSPILFFRFRWQIRHTQTPTVFVATLLYQVIKTFQGLRKLKQVHDSLRDGDGLDVLVLTKLLVEELSDLPTPAHVVVDAVDEGLQTHFGLLRAILGSLSQHARIFITSRELPAVLEEFGNLNFEEIQLSHQDDLRQCVRGRLHSRGDTDSTELDIDVERIIEASGGLYGVAIGISELYLNCMDELDKQYVLEWRDRNPPFLEEKVKDELKRINSQPVGMLAEKAMSLLCWLMFNDSAENGSGGSLATADILYAVALSRVLAVSSEKPITTVHGLQKWIGKAEDALTYCKGLVSLKDDRLFPASSLYTRCFQIHEKVQEIMKPHKEISSACITYLSFEDFQRRADTEEDYSRRLQVPLFEYAARNWGRHIRCYDAPTKELLGNPLMYVCSCEVMEKGQSIQSDSAKHPEEAKWTQTHLVHHCIREDIIKIITDGKGGRKRRNGKNNHK